ncbi:MAG: hypothetical protein V8R67_13175 [Eubacterium sp.]
MPLEPARSKKGNEKSGKSQNMLPFPAGCGQKGNEKRETQRNPLPLEPARSKKGNEKRGKSQNMLPFPARNRQKQATILKLKEAVHYECSSFFFNRFDASK